LNDPQKIPRRFTDTLHESGQISGNKALKNPERATPLPLDPAIYTPKTWDNMGNVTTQAGAGEPAAPAA
jgi:hypothetical protein